ncbi:MAG: hypothetical protein HPY57_14800 [Ignavibacteria bacterium]|nr:hypothetical protein [Ignavibacteria bacterium]
MATWVPSKEMCGVDLSHIDEFHQIPFEIKCLEWTHRSRQRIFCNDGFNMSVQGGFTAYSYHRKPVEIYDIMEVGFPSENEPLLENFDGQVAGYTDVMIIQQIKKYNIQSNKTYNPPNLDSILDDKLFSLIIGFIDGDGSITKQFKRKDAILRIKCHSSWVFILQKFLLHLYENYNGKIPSVKINNQGYACFNITNSIILKNIKNKCLELNLPILKRKWDNIDLSRISRMEK